MHQFVESAIEAAKQGDNNKALAFLKQVLNSNPDDVDAWLVLAAVVDDSQHKRQCLNRVLKLDPVNQVAREELLEMDRAEMGGAPPATPEPSPEYSSANTSTFESEKTLPQPTKTNPSISKTKTFQKSLLQNFLPTIIFTPVGLLILWVAFSMPLRFIFRIGAGAGIVLLAMAFSPLFQIITVKIKKDQLILETILTTTNLSKKEILDIRINSSKNLDPVNNSIRINLTNGRTHSLSGFPEGNQAIYDHLTNWLNKT